MTDLLPTGIDVLDRLLGGGIPPGSLVILSAQPTSQAETFLYELSRVRPTCYLTTIRSSELVRRSLRRTGVPAQDVDVRAIGPASAEPTHDDILRQATVAVDGLADGTSVVIDPMDVLERAEPSAYQSFLNELAAAVDSMGTIAVLHTLDGHSIPPQRDTTEYVADATFTLSTDVSDDRVETRLAVPKFRGRRALEETVKLDLAEGISFDLSRNIA